MGKTDLAIVGTTYVPQESLTKSEIEVLRLAAAGARNAEMARALGVSDKAVEARLTRLYRKMQVRSRLEAVVAAQEAGILEVASRPRESLNGSRPHVHDHAAGMQLDSGTAFLPEYDRSWRQNGNGSTNGGAKESQLQSAGIAEKPGRQNGVSETRKLDCETRRIKSERLARLLTETLVETLAILDREAGRGDGLNSEDSARLALMRAAREQSRLVLYLLEIASTGS